MDQALNPNERWINIMRAASECGVSRRTIYNWLNAGRLKTKRTAGGCLRIDASSLWRDADDDVAPLNPATQSGQTASV